MTDLFILLLILICWLTSRVDKLWR